jgi:molybdopterin-guanine dinucleotide biosynthesis protein A
MGSDKAKRLVEGEPLGVRIARLISESGIPVTVLGREPIPGHKFQADQQDWAGPLVALAAFVPAREFVFVASCDLVGFNPEVVTLLARRIEDSDAAVPVVNAREQPLCALYRRPAFVVAARLVAGGEQRVMRWLAALRRVSVEEIDPRWVLNVNTPDDLPAN